MTLKCAAAGLLASLVCLSFASEDKLRASFISPPPTARPWVYWYFMDGNLTEHGMTADLQAMKKAGIGGAIFLEVGIGVPKGPVEFMSKPWQKLVGHAFSEASRLGIELAMGAGPGWCGTGGPWVKPENSMQHLVASEISATGPVVFDAVLPKPQPRTPFFGEGSMNAEQRKVWREFYRDVVVVAFPTPAGNARLKDVDEKALYYRAPYSSAPGVKPFLTPVEGFEKVKTSECIPSDKVIDLTGKLSTDGRLKWNVPPGKWTIMRFGRTITGQTTRPAPDPGLGFESDKFDAGALDAHFDSFIGTLLRAVGEPKGNGVGLTDIHFDSWEMSSQNWSAKFREEFMARRKYDPLKMLPSMIGHVVDSAEKSERFLWDLRQTAQELVIQNHIQRLKTLSKKHGLTISVEPYDLNPTSDLELAKDADVPMGEFWSKGFGFTTEFSVIEATSIAHTNGLPIVGAESFTGNPGEDWRQYPGSMKNQTDWALCAGINRFAIHRFQAQPENDKFPGMGMGPYGVHWDRTQTWWDMVGPYHLYLSRCQEMLRRGFFVADILYLAPEGAPNVFIPPPSALEGEFKDRRGYNFDGCAPSVLMSRATVKNGRIVMPDGMSYRLLVLPRFDSMTPALLRKIVSFVKAGATVVGRPPTHSPSLVDYPNCDFEVKRLAAELWGTGQPMDRRTVGKGTVIFDSDRELGGQDGLRQARWIWTDEGNPTQSAPLGTRSFAKEISVNKKVASASVTISADNEFQLFVNQKLVGIGTDFNQIQTFEIGPVLKSGPNSVQVRVDNTGDAPNPAGLIASVTIQFSDGTSKIVRTDNSWVSAGRSVMDLGEMARAPWNLALKPNIYPDYNFTAQILSGFGVVPDFHTSGNVRYIHRKDRETDYYFVGNQLGKTQTLTADFRVTGKQPEWWNPVTGETRLLPKFIQKGNVTSIPLSLNPYESGFVIFRTRATSKKMTGVNFDESRPIQTLMSSWQVSFDPKWGGPSSVTFHTLTDWSKNLDPGIKFYSGKAIYRTTFDARTSGRVQFLSLGTVKNLASVKLNGKDLGIVWCEPWRVKIPAGLLKTTGNQLEITVANLWINRLIGDSALPPEKRLTWTTYQPFRPDSVLQESGLLGPVTLQK